MDFNWNKARKESKVRAAQTLKVLKSAKTDKSTLAGATRLALMFDQDCRRVESSFNKIASRNGKRAFLQRFKTPTHCLSGKYTPTVLALLEYINREDINLDRWILAQAELVKQPYFNLYMCYGEAALERYTAWETKQSKKFVREVDREKQTDSKLEAIRESIIAGHIAALSWIPQLKKIEAPDVATALYFLLPNLQGWYALCYEEFRTEVMESGLCDAPHMVAWYGKYNRSRNTRDTCASTLASVEKLYGKLAW